MMNTIETSTVIQIVDRSAKNPYDEGSPYWNCFIDIFCGAVDSNLVPLQDLIDTHREPLDYYQTYLPVLIEDGLIEINLVYKFRAECLVDVHRFMESISFSEYSVVSTLFPDVVVEFKSKLSITKLKAILKTIPDSHVMLETLALKLEYTGKRI